MAGTVRIGELMLRSRLILAPLERVSYVGFRHLCARQGASLTFTEMIRFAGPHTVCVLVFASAYNAFVSRGYLLTFCT